MNIFSRELIEILNTEKSIDVIFIGFLAIYTLTFFLRIIICIGYQAHFTHFNINQKPIDKKENIRIKNYGILNKVISDYIKISEKGIQSINIKSIVNKHLLRINFIGLSFTSIEKFVEGVEKNILFVSIFLAFIFDEYRILYTTCGVIIFLLIKIYSSIFDFSLVKQKLSEEVSVYIQTELGKFYVWDVDKLAKKLIKEISDSLIKHSENTYESIVQLNSILDSLKDSYNTVSVTNKALHSKMEYIEKNQEVLEQAMDKYEVALEDIARKTGDAIGKILEFHAQEAYGTLDESLKENIKQIIVSNSELMKRLEQLFMQLNDQSKVQTESLVKFREEIVTQINGRRN